MLQRHLREIGVELFGENHRHRGIDALAHLDLRHDQRGLAGMIDADEGVRRKLAGRVVGRLLRLVHRAHRQMEGEQKSAGQAALEQRAARRSSRRDLRAVLIAASYASPAARLIASRMRT